MVDSLAVTPRTGQVLEGAILPERVEVLIATPEGDLVRIVGRGLRTGQAHDLRLTANQLAALAIVGGEADFRGDPNRFRLGIEAMRLGLAYEYDPYFSLSIARVDPLPHQLEAVYDYFLRVPRIRFLLADDAGAGKTIMAGLLLKELKLRGLVDRVLVVSPANLMFQWQREMQDRFRERFDILRGMDLSSAYGTNPWQEHAQVITSIDWAKREEVQESLARSDWHLVIVDEAHRMSARDAEHKTERYRLGELLSDHSEHVVFLTGTPHKGDQENFCLFLRLLDRDVYGDVRSLEEAMARHEAPFYLRRTKEAMVTFPDPETGECKPLFRRREVVTAPFELLPDEFAFYKELTDYVYQQSARASHDQSPRGRAIGFTMAMYQRRFASSLHAAVRSLERRRKRLADLLATPQPVRSAAPSVSIEDLEELDEAEAEKIIEDIEEATLPIDRSALAEEIAVIDRLVIHGRQLEEREVSSKLQKLRSLLEDERVFSDPTMKLLVFTEHRDTLEWLVDRLRTWGLSVTQIHGSMKVGDRDTPDTRLYAERSFREESQVLVATEAAGEGINLQFCWLMVNFDIPWNPVRLEQRMGRIHRYGQEHDCLIFNFVALNTFEGRVLAKLLERLKAIGEELGTDQVFDVVGEVLAGNQIERLLRERYAGRLDENTVLDRVTAEADPERFRRITQSALESLARKELNLTALIGKMAEAKERRLVPEVVEQFFLDAAPLHDMTPQKQNGLVRVGRVSRPVQRIGVEQEQRFGRVGREYRSVVFDKQHLSKHPTAEWVTPGHPLFEAIRSLTELAAEGDLRRGAVFYELGRDSPARLEAFSAAIRDGRGNQLHRRLYVVEVSADGSLAVRQPTIFERLTSASGIPSSLPTVSPQVERPEIESFLVQEGVRALLDEVAQDRLREIAMVRTHVTISLDSLVDRQQRQLFDLYERGDEVALAVQQAEQRLEDLLTRKERRLRELDSEAEIAIADVLHLGTALVLPHPDAGRYAAMVSDAGIEAIAMAEAMRFERERGWAPQNVSAEDRGFDILSQDPATGAARFIEVKGRVGRGEVSLSRHEFATACRLRDDYWLYVVYDCGSSPEVLPIRDPARLDPEPVMSVEHYVIKRVKIEEAARD